MPRPPTETDGNGNWQRSNVYAASALIATYDADLSGATQGNLYFHLTDWLGTRRQQTDYAGNPCMNFTGLPYGDGLSSTPVGSGCGDATEHHFTGKERDTESGNDYFGARYYASSMGRFLSPDPSGLFFADQTNPQSLNLYAYVRNNPLVLTDPTGMDGCDSSPDNFSVNSDEDECPGYYEDENGNYYYWDGSYLSAYNPQSLNVNSNDDPDTCSMSDPMCQMEYGAMSQQWISSMQQQQAPNNPWNPCRTKAVLHGLFDLGLGAAKIGLGLATSETGIGLYEAGSGVSNVVSAGAELYGGLSGNLAAGERVANYASSFGSVSGIATFLATGNAAYGANASAIEGLATVGVTGGLVSTGAIAAPGLADNAVTAADNLAGAAGIVSTGGCQ